MKTALEWVNQIGEAASYDMFIGVGKPGCKVEEVIKQIQDEAYEAGYTQADYDNTHDTSV